MATPARTLETPPGPDLRHADTQRDLWLCWLCSTGPALWFVMLVCVYASSQHECEAQHGPLSLALLGLGGLGSSGACLLLQRMRTRLAQSQPAIPQHKRARLHFMVKSGLILNVLALTLLAGMVIPLLLLRPCE